MIWDAKFVGRENELKQLMYGVEQARRSHGSIIFITGEAGVGKTRLTEEFANLKSSMDFEYLRGECIYREGTDPYLPFVDMFKGYLSTHPYLATAVLASLNSPAGVIFDYYPMEKSRYSTTPEGPGPNVNGMNGSNGQTSQELGSSRYNTDKSTTDPNPNPNPAGSEISTKTSELQDIQLLEGKHRMFETISKIIIHISKRKPLVMFLDDLQWADEASLHLMHYLARNINNQPIMILGAYRPEELKYSTGHVQPLQELLTRIGAENLLNIIEVNRLDYEHTNEIVNNLLSVKNIPKDFSDLIYNDTEGNPFFVKEVLRTFVEDGALSIKKGKLVLNISSDEIVIPTSIKELINLQLQRLDADCVNVLEYSSIIGNEFNFKLLQNIIDMPEPRLIDILAKLTEAEFISEVKSGKRYAWIFSHNKTHETIYNNINDNKKKLIHLRIAKYLEDSQTENIDEVVYELAYHFYFGMDFDRALSYSIEGGEKAKRAYANKEALDLYNIALNSLRQLDETLAATPHYLEKKIEVLSQLGTLNKTFGEWDKALDYYEQILPICDIIKDNEKISKTYLDIGWIYQQRGYWNQSQKFFRKSLTQAESTKNQFISSEAYHGLGAVFEREGDLEQAIECYSISRKFAETNLDLLNLAKAHNAFGRIYNQQGNYMKAVEHKEKSIHIFEKLNNLPELAKAYTSLGLTYYDMGEMNKNIEFNEKCIELADHISDIRIKGYGLSNAVESLIKTDQLDKALKYASGALEIFKKLEERFMIALNYMNYGIIFKQKKEWNKAKYYFKTAIEFMENLKIPYHLADCYRQFADIYRMKNEPVKIKYYLEKAKEVYTEISATNYVNQIDDELRNIKLGT